MMRLGILGSTRGTNMLGLIDAIRNHQLQATIEIVISNKSQAMILERATMHGIPAQFLNSKGLSRVQFDEQISHLLLRYNVDLVVLIGYMRILSREFVTTWKDRVINVHPSLLPDFSGIMDLEVHQAVIDSGRQESGCTIHFVTEVVDDGPIILQKKCKVCSNDSADLLKARVQELEKVALIEAIQLLSM